MSKTLHQIIEEDLSILRRHKDIGSKLGAFLDSGSYGFVVEYLDGSSEPKVIKILDPDYVESSFHATHPQVHSTLLTRSAEHIHQEWDNAQRIGYTKSPHLMPLLSGPKRLEIDGRSFSFLVMPRLRTMEELEPSLQREQQIVSILSDCCSGLQVLHQQPEIVAGRKNGMDAMVHCDIKPNNIFCTSGNSPRFMLGDYSITQKMADLEAADIRITSPDNPYCAPGALGKTSDIYSLGWVLFYWLNGKKHPTRDDVIARESFSLSCPPSWGDNPELWNVFLRMTKPNPAHRYQKAEEVKAALQKALRDRESRLAGQTASQRYDEGKTEGHLEGAGIILVVSAAYHILKLIFGSDPISSDGEGRLHGNIKKNIPYLGGNFKGIWEHGVPAEGTYISPSGNKRSGKWRICDGLQEPFFDTGIQIFTGLAVQEPNKETSWQGQLEIRWPWGARFQADLDAGIITNGILTFSDGTELRQKFEYCEDPNAFSGILCGEKKGNVTGCAKVMFDQEQNIFAECELRNNVPGPGILFLPRSITLPHTASTYEQAMDLLVNMCNAGGRFEGLWTRDGFPKTGTYYFRNRKTVSGDFSFVEQKEYSQATYTGMIGDDGLPWGVGTAEYVNGKIFTGEFFEGAPVKP